MSIIYPLSLWSLIKMNYSEKDIIIKQLIEIISYRDNLLINLCMEAEREITKLKKELVEKTKKIKELQKLLETADIEILKREKEISQLKKQLQDLESDKLFKLKKFLSGFKSHKKY